MGNITIDRSNWERNFQRINNFLVGSSAAAVTAILQQASDSDYSSTNQEEPVAITFVEKAVALVMMPVQQAVTATTNDKQYSTGSSIGNWNMV